MVKDEMTQITAAYQQDKLAFIKNPVVAEFLGFAPNVDFSDVGQMDMYVRIYDALKRTDGDNPTIGLILCSETSTRFERAHFTNFPEFFSVRIGPRFRGWRLRE